MKKFVFILVTLFAGSLLAQKNSVVERTFEGSSKDKNPTLAKRQIQEEATRAVSETLIKEIIGEAKYGRNKALIEQKILKNSARYIPLSHPGELKQESPDLFKMSVQLKISIDDLQSLLLENGLFYESDSTPVVLPLIRWSDKVGLRSYSWWNESEGSDRSGKNFLMSQNQSFESMLKSVFAKNQFYVLRPVVLHFSEILKEHRADKWNADELQMISQKLGAQIVLDGEIQVIKSADRSEAYVIQIRISALQVQNGRSIAEVSRNIETDPGAFDAVVDRKLKDLLEQAGSDLASQVQEAWSRGTLGSSLYKLTLKGRLPLLQQEAFKEAFKSKAREIKDIKERLISDESLVFELDSLISPVELGKKIPDLMVSPYRIVFDSSRESEIIYKIQKESDGGNSK